MKVLFCLAILVVLATMNLAHPLFEEVPSQDAAALLEVDNAGHENQGERLARQGYYGGGFGHGHGGHGHGHGGFGHGGYGQGGYGGGYNGGYGFGGGQGFGGRGFGGGRGFF